MGKEDVAFRLIPLLGLHINILKDINIYLVLVLLGCCNKVPQTSGLKQENFISYSSGSWKSEIRLPAWSSEGCLPGHSLLVVSSRGRRGEGAP